MKKELLPIGSVVLLKDGIKKAMITGYFPVTNVGGKKVAYDYSGCVFPEGILSSDQLGMFNYEQIREVIFEGFKNEESLALIERIEKIDKNIALQNYQNESSNEIEELDY